MNESRSSLPMPPRLEKLYDAWWESVQTGTGQRGRGADRGEHVQGRLYYLQSRRSVSRAGASLLPVWAGCGRFRTSGMSPCFSRQDGPSRCLLRLSFNVIFAWKCSSTHHKLALDALIRCKVRRLRTGAICAWPMLAATCRGRRLRTISSRTFAIHVLHVRDGLWGGAITSTGLWYNETVSALKAQDWRLRSITRECSALLLRSTDAVSLRAERGGRDRSPRRRMEHRVCLSRADRAARNAAWRVPDVPVPSGRNWLECRW